MTEQCAEGGNSCMAADPSLFLLLVVYLFCKSKGKDLPIALVFFDHCQHEGWGCTSKWERGMLILGVGREPHPVGRPFTSCSHSCPSWKVLLVSSQELSAVSVLQFIFQMFIVLG